MEVQGERGEGLWRRGFAGSEEVWGGAGEFQEMGWGPLRRRREKRERRDEGKGRIGKGC